MNLYLAELRNHELGAIKRSLSGPHESLSRVIQLSYGDLKKEAQQDLKSLAAIPLGQTFSDLVTIHTHRGLVLLT